jgi:hypothetical protein
MQTRPYDVDPRHYEELGDDMDKRHGSGDIYNGSTKIITWMMALLNVLISAGIIGGIIMYGRVGVLEEKVMDMGTKIDLIITGRIRVPNGP